MRRHGFRLCRGRSHSQLNGWGSGRNGFRLRRGLCRLSSGQVLFFDNRNGLGIPLPFVIVEIQVAFLFAEGENIVGFHTGFQSGFGDPFLPFFVQFLKFFRKIGELLGSVELGMRRMR